MPQEWHISDIDEHAAQRLASELGIHPITTRVIMNRGIATPADARRYLSPELSDIPDPFSLPDMDRAVQRLCLAIERGERIAVFGDYDVDGVTGTALLVSFLKEIGIEPIAALPSRTGEGYGLTARAVDDLIAQGAGLIVTVDNGARAIDAITRARESGVDVVVTDHHDAGGLTPHALAIVNPKRLDKSSPLHNLSGCGVAFMLALALRKHLRGRDIFKGAEPNLRQHLDLVALGTIADSVELSGANRTLVRHGLAEIERSAKPGIRALTDVSGIDPASLSSWSVAFQLAPRINAAGRLGDAMLALELLLCDDPARAESIARVLDGANRERQRMEERILSEATAKIDRDGRAGDGAAIILSSKGWHVGVIGIVAAKIAEKTGRPAVVISRDTRPARGSARSYGGVNLVDALSRCGDMLAKFGGHAMAAGLSLDEGNIDAFSKRFDEACGELAAPAAGKSISIDAVADPADITRGLIDEFSSCRPFGTGNPEPILSMHDMDVLGQRIVGDGHLKLRVRAKGVHFDAIGFGMAGDMPDGTNRVSLAFVPELNTWNGITSVQLKIRDVKCENA